MIFSYEVDGAITKWRNTRDLKLDIDFHHITKANKQSFSQD